MILDRSFFTKWVSATINDDFYLILFISSFLISSLYALSYGRIRCLLISFSPMFISWIYHYRYHRNIQDGIQYHQYHPVHFHIWYQGTISVYIYYGRFTE